MSQQEVGYVEWIQWQRGSAPRGAIRLIISPEKLMFRPSTRLVNILTLGMIPILEFPLSAITVAAPVRKVWGLPTSAVRFQVVDFKRPILFGTKEVERIVTLLQEYGVPVDWHPSRVPYRML
jgi:hypothetical protein